MEFIGEEGYEDDGAVALDGSSFYLRPAPLAPASRTPDVPRAAGMADSFRETMRTLASGVVLVTTEVGGRPWGVTVTSCCSLSLEPPRLLVSLTRHTASCEAIEAAGVFGVNLLGDAHKRLAELGSARGAPKFLDPRRVSTDRTTAPMIDGALSHLDCEVEQVFDGDGIAILVGRVTHVVAAPPHGSASPLLYFDGGFYHLGGPL